MFNAEPDDDVLQPINVHWNDFLFISYLNMKLPRLFAKSGDFVGGSNGYYSYCYVTLNCVLKII